MNTEQIQQEAEFIRDPTEKGIYMYGFKDGYNACQSRHAWVKVSDRLPTEEDANDAGDVQAFYRDDNDIIVTYLIKWNMVGYGYWRTPLDNNFPKNESNGFYCKEYESNGYLCDEGQCEKCAKIDNP